MSNFCFAFTSLIHFLHNDDFTKTDLKKYLSNLFSEYVTSVAGIEKAIEAFEITKNQIKNNELRSMRLELRKAVKGRDIATLKQLYFDMLDNKKSFEPLLAILSKFEHFFYHNISNEYLDKIKKNIEYVESMPFYKWG